MDIRDLRKGNCVIGTYPWPKPIIVKQLVGEECTQKSFDICIIIPRDKPAAEQIVDVFVKKVRIKSVEVLTGKVIVRGHFEVKALYVACLPQQPVHAAEVHRVRFTADVCIPGARCGMDADVSVKVEYIDYDCGSSKKRWHKYEKDHEDCDYYGYHDHYKHGHKPPDWECEDKKGCFRRFDVAVVLEVCAKVFADRELVIYPSHPAHPVHPVYPGLPAKPKG